MAIKAIVAVGENLEIGRDGQIPWHYSEDLRFFKQTTSGHAIVMGSATFRSLGKKPLPNRLNIVLSRSESHTSTGNVLWMNSVESVVQFGQWLKGDLFVIGGSQVYEAFGPHIQEWIVTRIPLSVPDADTFMPASFLDAFGRSERYQIPGGELMVEEFSRKPLVP